MTRCLPLLTLLLCTLAGGCDGGAAKPNSSGVLITPQAAGFRIEIDGSWLGDYQTTGGAKPFLHPLRALDGTPVTREIAPANSTDDHPHHDSFWYAHGNVNGKDFWRSIPTAGRAVVAQVLEASSGAETGTIRTLQNLVLPDGTILGTDERTLRVHRRSDCRMLDYEVTWIASHGPLHLGATKESAMGVRVADSMRADLARAPRGVLVNSQGTTGKDVATQRAEWVDAHGPIHGQTYGIALLDHPANPLHPPWWMAREYGLIAASPFGGHELAGTAETDCEISIPAGGRVTFRYRVIVHSGDQNAANIARFFAEFTRTGVVPEHSGGAAAQR